MPDLRYKYSFRYVGQVNTYGNVEWKYLAKTKKHYVDMDGVLYDLRWGIIRSMNADDKGYLLIRSVKELTEWDDLLKADEQRRIKLEEYRLKGKYLKVKEERKKTHGKGLKRHKEEIDDEFYYQRNRRHSGTR